MLIVCIRVAVTTNETSKEPGLRLSTPLVDLSTNGLF